MINDIPTHDYRAFKAEPKRRFTLYLYLILFGIIVGVFLTNYITGKKKETSGNITDEGVSNELRTISSQETSPPPETVITANSQQLPLQLSPDVREFETAVIAASEKAMPAVVSIHVRGTRVVYYSFRDPFLRMLYGNQMQRKPVNGMG